MPPPLLVRALLALLVSLWAAECSAGSTRANLALGLAFPQNGRVGVGAAYGVEGGLRLNGRLAVVGGLVEAAHGLTSSTRVVDATTLSLGLELDLDLTPLIPTLSAGPALQLARRRDASTGVIIPGAFFGVGLGTHLFERLFLGAEVRYLTSGFAQDNFPGYGLLLLRAGWQLGP